MSRVKICTRSLTNFIKLNKKTKKVGDLGPYPQTAYACQVALLKQVDD